MALKDLDDHIECERPVDKAELAKWERSDRKAQAVIGLSLSDEHLEHVRECTSAKEMWKTLMDVFERHTLLNKLAARRNFYTVTMQEGEKVLTYVNRVQQLASVLKSMDVDIDDKEMAMAVLNGLPPHYDSLIVALDALGNEDRLFTLDFVKSRLLQEEQTANMRHSRNVRNKNAALLNTARPPRSQHKCTNCGRIGHTADRCWGKDINGRRPLPSNNNRGPRKNDGNRHNRNQDMRENKQSAFVTHDHHEVVDQFDEADYTCLMSKIVKSGMPTGSSSWIIDSACTSHMTFDRSSFVSYEELTNTSVEMGTKDRTRIAGRGNIVVDIDVEGRATKCVLKDVLHVPEFEYSLISVNTVDVQGVSTLFENRRCHMFKNKKTLLTGTLKGSLYILDEAKVGSSSKDTPNVAALSKDHMPPLYLWHERLAHVNKQGIVNMARNNVVEGLKLSWTKDDRVCRSCVVGKIPRSLIPKSRSSERATELLELVHSDVCGPMQVPSLGGARYFVSFIDDHSEWATVFTMRRKSEVFDKYKTFEHFAQRQTGRKVRTLRTDRGGEYMSKEFDEHLTENGIAHQFSTVESPFQNGVSERLNRTLMDLVRSMLFARGLC